MIVNDPWIRLQRKWQALRALLAVLTGIYLLASTLSLFLPALNVLRGNNSSNVVIGLVFVLATCWFFLERKALKHRIKQRQNLLGGDMKPLASEQPSPDVHALSLPTKIALHPKLGVMSLLYGAFVLLALLFVGGAVWSLILFFSTPYDPYYTGNDPIAAAACAGLALYFGGLLWFMWSRLYSWVKVTDTGMEARFNGRRMRIVWTDARIFSVDGMDDPKAPRIYTLSGEQGSVVLDTVDVEDSNGTLSAHNSL